MSSEIKRTRQGRVIRDNREKTCVVQVDWKVRHPKFGKVVNKYTRFHVHDPENKACVGDWVSIQEVRPISKTKTWELVSVLEKVS